MKTWIAGALAMSLVVVACSEGDDTTTTSGSTTTDTTGSGGATTTTTGSGGGGATTTTTSSTSNAPCTKEAKTVVTMTTDDNVKLEGDLWTTGITGGPGVVLLHMIPPNNTRKNYPDEFINKLVAKGMNVLNIDRRGAGASEGVAKEAYLGPNGKLDAEAAVELLLAHECAIGTIGLVGASNGTTTALDFTVAATSLGYEVPAALVFLTGGGYTEAQNKINANMMLLSPIPILFNFPANEAVWSKKFESGAPAAWKFDEYNQGGHGTQMFLSKPESMDEVAAFLAAL